MPDQQGRHELPGWRGYLPDDVDRAARTRAAGSGARRRVVAVGALAACALGGAVIPRSDGPPETLPAPADDGASALARSAAWTREATPVLAAISSELRRTDEVRHRWDTSALAGRAASPPRAVVVLGERRAELARHRDELGTALAAVRAAPTSESALVVARPRLRAAQNLLRALASGRGELGDPVEATVLRLVREESDAEPPPAGPRSGLDVVLAASTRESTRQGRGPIAAAARATAEAPVVARRASPDRAAAPAAVRTPGSGFVPAATGAAETPGTPEAPETPGPPDALGERAEEPRAPADPSPSPPGRTILSFDRSASSEEDTGAGPDVPADAPADEPADVPDVPGDSTADVPVEPTADPTVEPTAARHARGEALRG